MLKKLYDSNKKVIAILIILLITLYLLPSVLYRPYEMNISTPIRNRIGRAGETIEFEWIFEQEDGFQRHFEIEDINMRGDWHFNNNGTSINVPPDSTVIIYIIINIPEDAENEDYYYLGFHLIEKSEQRSWLESYTVTVDNNVPPEIEIDPGHGSHKSYGSNIYFSPLLFIPLIIIIFCVYLLIMALTERRHRLPPTPGRES